MKENLLLLFLYSSGVIFFNALFTAHCFAQPGTWTWIKGDTGIDATGNFGIQGIADPQNEPPAFSHAPTWVDLQGNFWMFGGWYGPLYSDLWKFDPQTENWTWVKGPGIVNQPGVFGTQGIPSPANNPPCVFETNLTWVDSSDNLWMYGGWGGDCGTTFDNEMAALWRYSISTNEWTWMNGTQLCHVSPVHGTLNVPSPANTPGSRYETYTSWRSHDSLYLFGGRNTNTTYHYYNDLWKYDLSTNEWTWIKGPSVPDNTGSYGTFGVPDPANNPSARSSSTRWTGMNGDFWMLGSSYPPLTDIWKYDPPTNIWTWVGGPNTWLDTGNYVMTCSPDTSQRPPWKQENRASWRDANGLFYNFGGNIIFSRNDLWVYCPTVNRWSWIKGADTFNVANHYGVQGVGDPANTPSSRWASTSWTDTNGRLWLWGGKDIAGGWKSDLWRFDVDYSCFGDACSLNATFVASNTNLCEKFCIDFIDQSLNNPISWLWLFPGGTPASSTNQNPSQICYQEPGIYDVTLITSNANGSDTLTVSNYVTVYPTPPFPAITQNGYTLTSSVATSYQWQFNTVDIAGATNQSYDVQQSGYYTIVITDENGCVSSTSTYILIVGMEEVNSNTNVLIYPNPSNGNFTIDWLNSQITGEFKMEIRNTIGQVVFSEDIHLTPVPWKKEIDLCGEVTRCISSGIYFLKISAKTPSENSGTNFINKKLIVIR